MSREQLCLHAFYPENLAMGLQDGTIQALKQGAQLHPPSELMKYLARQTEYKRIRTKWGGVELTVSV
jgi:hypothetical protein